MVFVLGVLAASAGVLLAAFDSPHVRETARVRRCAVALLTLVATAVAVGAFDLLID